MNIKADPELELIICIIRIKEKPFNVDEVELLKQINWEKFIKLCTYHGVISIVYKKLKSVESDFIPEKTIAVLKKLYQQIVQWNFIQSNQLVKVLTLLKKNNIDAIPIKGPVVSVQAYGDIGYRIFQDIDILINPDDFADTYEILCSNDFKSAENLTKKKKKLWKKFKRDVEFRKNKTMIDIHQRITQAHSAFDIPEDRFLQLEIIDILDHDISVFSVEETLIYSVINSTKDNWNMLRMIADLSFLIQSNPNINWGYILKRSKKMGIKRMVITGLVLMSKITDELLPEIVISELRKDNRINKLVENYKNLLLFKRSGNKTPDRVKSIYVTLDSPVHKFRYFLYFLFTPTPEDFRWVSLPESLYFLYRIIRPVRLLTLALRRQG